MSEPVTQPPADWAPLRQLAALLVVAAALLLAAFPYFEQVRNANELPRLVQAMSLVESGEWAIDGPSRRDIPLGPDIARSPVDGRVYPNKPPGASVVGALAYSLAKLGSEPPSLRELTWWARLLAGTLPVLVIVALAWGRLRSAYSGAVIVAAISLMVFGSPLFAYGRLFYGHTLAASLLFAGVLAIERGRSSARAEVIALGGLLAATAVTVEYGAAFAGIPIAVALLWGVVVPSGAGPSRSSRGRAAKLALAGLGGALVPIALLALYQRALFGSVLATGYHHAADPGFAALHGQGLLGLGLPRWSNVEIHLLAPDTGLLAWSPLVVFAVLGLLRLARRRGELRSVAILQLSIFAVITLMGLGLSFEGGWRIGPRYLVVALPMLIIGLAEFIAHWRDHPRPIACAVAMGGLGVCASWSLVANTFAATLWPHIDPTNINEPIGAVLLPLWEHGFGPYGLPSWFRGGLSVSLVAPIALGLGALTWAGGTLRPQVVLLPLLLGIGVGAMIVLVLIPRSVVAHHKTEANLRWIEQVYEPRIHDGKRIPAPSRVLTPH